MFTLVYFTVWWSRLSELPHLTMQSLPSLQAHQSQASAPQQGLDQNAQRTFASFFPTPGSFPQSYPNVPFPLMPYFTTNLPDQSVRDFSNLFNVRDSTSKERDDDLFDTRKSHTTDRIHDHTRERPFRNNSNSNSPDVANHVTKMMSRTNPLTLTQTTVVAACTVHDLDRLHQQKNELLDVIPNLNQNPASDQNPIQKETILLKNSKHK